MLGRDQRSRSSPHAAHPAVACQQNIIVTIKQPKTKTIRNKSAEGVCDPLPELYVAVNLGQLKVL